MTTAWRPLTRRSPSVVSVRSEVGAAKILQVTPHVLQGHRLPGLVRLEEAVHLVEDLEAEGPADLGLRHAAGAELLQDHGFEDPALDASAGGGEVVGEFGRDVHGHGAGVVGHGEPPASTLAGTWAPGQAAMPDKGRYHIYQ